MLNEGELNIMEKIIVLGSGMVGSAIAIDICHEFEVSSVDLNPENLKFLSDKFPIKSIEADLSNNDEIGRIIEDYDLVIGAAPGFMGFEVVKNVIKCKKNIVDISFFPENLFELDELAKENNVTAIVDCGVAPGMSNLIAGFHNERMKISDLSIYVGGLPVKRELPYQYKAPFSPIDVIEEYTRPARLVENGKIVIKEALTEPEHLEFEGIGTLVAFNTDGLRSVLQTMNILNMKEKTLRYPGHIENIKLLRDTGFFSQEPIIIKGSIIKPIELTSKLLFTKWKLEKGEEEFTVMRIIIEGEENGKEIKYTYDLFDKFDKETNISSMARTTGYTATAAAHLVLNRRYNQIGISPPEFIGKNEENYEFILNYLANRNIHYKCRVE
jgi:lysine 6-dehydrogenase